MDAVKRILVGTKMNENSPIYNNPFHVPLSPPQRWRKVSERNAWSMQVQRSEGARDGPADMEPPPAREHGGELCRGPRLESLL